MRIALLANLKKNAPTWSGMSPDQWDELDSEKTLHDIEEVLCDAGHDVTFLEGDATIFDNLFKLRPDLCFNICEGHFGDAREAQVPAMLEMLRIPYTGSRVLTLALTLDKPMTKRILAYHDLPTPAFQVFERLDEPRDPDLRFPLFVKPSREGTGMGVSADSVVNDDGGLRRQIEHVFARYDQPALVEHYIEGREITVGVVGNLVHPVARRIPEDTSANRVTAGLHFFPPLEVDLAHYAHDEGEVYTNRMKVELAEDFHYSCPASLSDEQVNRLNWLTASVFRVTGCLDVARVDFRLDKHDHDRPYILEVNPLPGLRAGYSDLCIEATAGGWSYSQLINTIVDLAIARYGLA